LKSKNVKTVQKRLFNNHDSLSLKSVYAGNMCKNIPHICSIHAPHISPNSAYFTAILPQKVPHISRKFNPINQHS